MAAEIGRDAFCSALNRVFSWRRKRLRGFPWADVSRCLRCARWRGSHATVEQVGAYSFSGMEFRGFAVSGGIGRAVRVRRRWGGEKGDEKRRRPTIHYTTRHNDAYGYLSACHAPDMAARIFSWCSHRHKGNFFPMDAGNWGGGGGNANLCSNVRLC